MDAASMMEQVSEIVGGNDMTGISGLSHRLSSLYQRLAAIAAREQRLGMLETGVPLIHGLHIR